ncbi:MAG: hypothetical protein LBE13_07540 [Bacteroidales bacterium]|nr:hypothetical protein [Bacteroidales bacterium]
MSKEETYKLLSRSFEEGFKRGVEFVSMTPEFISRNQANKKFNPACVKKWIEEGKITGKPLGNGKTSKTLFSLAKLRELSLSEEIVIRKPYNVK